MVEVTPRAPRARAAIFDMDGLLVDSEPFWRSVQTAELAALGSDVVPIIERGLIKGMRVDETVALFRNLAPFQGPSDEALIARIVAGVVAEIEAHAVLMPGALEALDRLEAAGLKLALASGSVPPVVDAVLDRFVLRERFLAVSSAIDDPLGKPHPAIFLRTAEALGVDALDCVVLEDSINGVIAAKAAKMRVIAVPAAADLPDPRFAVADVVLSSLEEIATPAAARVLGFVPGARSPDEREFAAEAY